VTMITRFHSGHSRSAYIIFGALVFLTLVGSRLSFRLFDSILLARAVEDRGGHRTRVLIYGAGKGGKLLHEEVQSNGEMRDYIIVGFIDDDPARLDGKLCGLPVKPPEYWVKQSWPTPPEIWVSSRAIPDRSAQLLTEAWTQPVQVRRLSLRMEPMPLQDPAGAYCPISAGSFSGLYDEPDAELSSPVSPIGMGAQERRH
jgi:FlaA1/EpsC-like NDP-sugar epimerase